MLTLLKIILSIPIGFGLAYPFINPNISGGILGELQIFGPIGSIVALVVFLVLIFFYARDLIKSLHLVSPTLKIVNPNSVWFMFLIPYNFIEDFFIVSNVAKSLKAEAAINPKLAKLKSFGMFPGIGWCTAQIISLIPNQVGSIAGLVAITFWVWHWILVRKANHILIESNKS